MPTDPDQSTPDDPLPEVPLNELIERARMVGHPETLMDARGELVVALRARGMVWRKIEEQTGIPQANARRWYENFLKKQEH
jgi:hypothetical protein